MGRKTNNRLQDRLKTVPIKIRVSTIIQFHFLKKLGGSVLMPVDEESIEYKEIAAINEEALLQAQPLIDEVTQEIDKWIRDGMPKGEIKKESDESKV